MTYQNKSADKIREICAPRLDHLYNENIFWLTYFQRITNRDRADYFPFSAVAQIWYLIELLCATSSIGA